MRHSRTLIAIILVMSVALGVRWVGVGTFMTVDEENWMLRSGGFWRNLFINHDPGGTFMTTHPGATLMWLAGAGIRAQEVRQQVSIDTSNLRLFRRAATIPVLLAITLLIGISTWQSMRLWGRIAGTTTGLLLAVQPYLLGMSQITHLDPLLALFMLSALLAILTGHRTGRRRDYLVAGIMTGLAVATKLMPAAWLFVFLAGYLVISEPRRQWRTTVATWWFVVGVAAVTFYLLWPVLWFSDDVMRSFNRDVPSVITQDHVALETSDEPITPASFYVRTFLARTTPYEQLALLGVGGVLIMEAVRRRKVPTTPLVVVGYALGYLVMITLVAKKADRYALPALISIPLLIGWLSGHVWHRVAMSARTKYLVVGGAVLTFSALVITSLTWVPYTIAYNNPLVPNIRPLSQQGWGEGLDQAAAWLNQLPRAERMYVASWYPGVMSTYFNGLTFSLSSRHDGRVAYVVTYRNMGGRANDSQGSDVLDEFAHQEPIHTISIHGTPYVWIYQTLNVKNFSNHIGELIGGVEVGQLVPVPTTHTVVDQLEIGFSTFSGRANTEDVIVHIRSELTSTEDLRTIHINARAIKDNEWHRVTFAPLPDAAGHEFYVAIESPTSTPGNAVTVRTIPVDQIPGTFVLRRQPLTAGESMREFVQIGDAAIRLPAAPRSSSATPANQ